jgi:hypothetical protein
MYGLKNEIRKFIENSQRFAENKVDLPRGPALQIEDISSQFDHLLTPMARKVLSVKTSRLVDADNNTTCRFLAVRASKDRIPKAAKHLYDVVNKLVELDLVTSVLAPLGTLAMAVNAVVDTSPNTCYCGGGYIVFLYVHVPDSRYDEFQQLTKGYERFSDSHDATSVLED